MKTQRDYKQGQEELEMWLEKAQTLLNTTSVCTVNVIKAYAEKLKVFIFIMSTFMNTC